jgi:hypothetical protein
LVAIVVALSKTRVPYNEGVTAKGKGVTAKGKGVTAKGKGVTAKGKGNFGNGTYIFPMTRNSDRGSGARWAVRAVALSFLGLDGPEVFFHPRGGNALYSVALSSSGWVKMFSAVALFSLQELRPAFQQL